MQSSSDPRIIEPVELRVENVSKSFGSFRALHDVNVTARLGQVTALVPNFMTEICLSAASLLMYWLSSLSFLILVSLIRERTIFD